MDLKSTKAPVSTVTYNRNQVDAPTDNIYEAISVIAKRAEQINTDIRRELVDKLEEFAEKVVYEGHAPYMAISFFIGVLFALMFWVIMPAIIVFILFIYFKRRRKQNGFIRQ